MKLKKLVLQGYKTFASKTEFVFDEGITAVVGPNGSGKSNIADAVRWVLGEQSYRTLRGKRTTDMIFAGSQTRPRAGMAQAILTLDNSDGWLPIDYTEVEIGRRAYRSGENEYILNGQKVRLKDVVDLLSTSGLAERTYTIIGQGLIDQALSLRAEERRALFEEAAGINHYKSRRAETLRRLQETQHNLQRVHDILSEIRPRLTSLKRQATRAQNYEQIHADLNHLLRIWYGYRWEQAKVRLREARETAVSTETSWQERRTILSVKQNNINELRQRINRQQQRLSDVQDERDSIRDRLESARREVAILHERKQLLSAQLAELQQDVPPLTAQKAQAAAELNAAVQELTAAQENLQRNQEALRQFNTAFQTKQAEINRWQQTLKQSVQQRQTAQNRLAQAEGQRSQLQERLVEAENSSDQAGKDELAQFEAQIKQTSLILDDTNNTLKTEQTNFTKVQSQRLALISQLKQLRSEHRQAEKALNELRNRTARAETRVEMLDKARQKTIPVGKINGLRGQLASFITIPDVHQTAVEAALHRRLEALIVENDSTLWQLLESSIAQNGVTAVSLSTLRPSPSPPLPQAAGVIDWAANVITANDELQALVQLILGQTLLVDDARTAYQAALTLPAGFAAVAQNGTLVYAGGLVETANPSAESSALAREKAWREAQKTLDSLQSSLANTENEVTLQQALIQEKQEATDALQEQERQLNQVLQETNQQLAQTQRRIDRMLQQQTYLQKQQASQAQLIERIQERLAEVNASITKQQNIVKACETAVLEAEAQLAALPVAEAQQEREILQQAVNSAQTIVAGRQAVVDSRRATLNQLEQQLGRLQARETALREQQTAIAESTLEDKRIQLQDQLTTLDAQIGPQKARLQNNRQEMRKLEDESAVLQKQTHDLETIFTQARVHYTQVKNEIEALQDRIKSDLGIVALSYDDTQTGPTPLPIGGVEALPQVEELPDDIEETIQSYRGQMQRMGAINPDAPVEYQETQERYDFMIQQIDDLNQTEHRLREIIAELDELTSRAFAETVDKVNTVFGRTFTQLFGGGAARLVLTDPDDLTISGVDIVARLPNRREQGLGLLSGGERSLTAAALIFSLLRVSPTPFCIMDEVDAALDEANINRFRELLRDLSLASQFIVITHNRGTVQAAQTIYGISMGTDSTSQAISIKPEDYIKQPELM